MSTKGNIEILSLEQYLQLKEDGFEFEGQSYLFWEYVRLWKDIKPKYFLLENVRMSKKWKDVISGVVGIEPIEIDSSLVSAQRRKRLYWTNISNVEQPRDKKVLLKDIVLSGIVDTDKSYCIDASYFKGGNLKQYFEKSRKQLVFRDDKKTKSFLKKSSGTLSYYKAISQLTGVDEKSNCITNSGQRFSNSGSTNLMYKLDGEIGFRHLTPVECELLQTVPVGYTDNVSNSQRYKMLGNGWTVDVIVHILKNKERE